MSKENGPPFGADAKPSRDQTPSTGPPVEPSLNEVLHDLRTHQIELEVQNEELRTSEGRLLEWRHRYSDIYDNAPVGYPPGSA